MDHPRLALIMVYGKILTPTALSIHMPSYAHFGLGKPLRHVSSAPRGGVVFVVALPPPF